MNEFTGLDFDYDTFQFYYDSHPQLQNIVSNFDKHGLTLSINEPESEPEQDSQSSIDSTAKKAANKILNK